MIKKNWHIQIILRASHRTDIIKDILEIKKNKIWEEMGEGKYNPNILYEIFKENV